MDNSINMMILYDIIQRFIQTFHPTPSKFRCNHQLLRLHRLLRHLRQLRHIHAVHGFADVAPDEFHGLSAAAQVAHGVRQVPGRPQEPFGTQQPASLVEKSMEKSDPKSDPFNGEVHMFGKFMEMSATVMGA